MASASVTIPAGAALLDGDLTVPDGASGLVLFAHGSGSSRKSPRNVRVAADLRAGGRCGTLLFDLLTAREDERYETRFDIGLLAARLESATEWVRSGSAPGEVRGLPLGYFGASTGAAAALVAAARRRDIAAIVSRGGRPDLAGEYLAYVRSPTLLIVGGDDMQVIGLNRMAIARMRGVAEMAIVPGATHLFEEPGALEEVSRLALGWFENHLG